MSTKKSDERGMTGKLTTRQWIVVGLWSLVFMALVLAVLYWGGDDF